jgi:DNA-binding Lrp family transcriptional regulator
MANESKIDLIDKKILIELDKNCREHLSKISRKIKKSKQLVDYRIKKLENANYVSGYNTLIDFSKLGFISFRVYIKLKPITPEKEKAFLDFLKNQSEVWWLVSVENICDIAYATLVNEVYDFYTHLDKLSRYADIIETKQIVIYSHITQFTKSYILDEKEKDAFNIGKSNKSEFDESDIKLLKIISENARMPLIDIAVKMKIKPQSVMYRLKKLEEKGIIKGYRAKINIEKLGYKNYKIYINLLNNLKIRELENYCHLNSNIVTINRTIGGHDFEIELQLEDIKKLYKILDEIKEKFSQVIKSFEYGIAREEIKMTYFPL